MSSYARNDENSSDVYYETVASQEEFYLEETEEEVREVLTSQDLSPKRNLFCVGETLSEQLNHAVEELITGDSDDPPLSEEEVASMMNPG
ncbi:MAG TPA: hypothetical protein VF135_11095 [Terriglobales bacterium]